MSLPACFASPTDSDAADARALVVLDRTRLTAWREAQPPAIRAWIDGHAFTGSGGGFLAIPGSDGRPQQILVGVNDASDPLALSHLPVQLPAGTYRLSPDSPVRIDPALAMLGWGLGAYQFDRYLRTPRALARLVLEDAAPESAEAFALLRAATLVRDLVNTPAEHMGPDELEAVAIRIAQAYGAQAGSIVGDELLKQNFPTLHLVGRASPRAPRLIEVRWGKESDPAVVIVGKGVCFDSGGLDIKAADGMRNMKKDMGGAAHALALAQLVMARQLPIRLTLLLAVVDNAISGNAFRPGDVITTRQGLSVEIDNTDAEGRLVLCDALAYASEKKPALILDFATLTGAARIALGADLPALFCNDEALAADYLAAGLAARDPLWRLPLWQPYLRLLKSNVADLANSSPSRHAGAITAALYLERFVGDGLPWAHVDVYAWNDGDRPGKPAGGDAQGLRAAFGLLKARYPSA
jgi:leucyl aminopeptidase